MMVDIIAKVFLQTFQHKVYVIQVHHAETQRFMVQEVIAVPWFNKPLMMWRIDRLNGFDFWFDVSYGVCIQRLKSDRLPWGHPHSYLKLGLFQLTGPFSFSFSFSLSCCRLSSSRCFQSSYGSICNYVCTLILISTLILCTVKSVICVCT